ncbi:MAG: type II secretion system protein [Planctomycetota bacterium]|jgi:prepilin-type N-terminal cleavage/methylation domain-containing protein
MEDTTNHTLRRNADGRRRPEGFSLIELLVVIAIVSVLMGIGLPVLVSVRCKMSITRDIVHTRQTAGAEIMYAHENDGRFAKTLATIWSPLGGWDSYEPSTLVNVDFPPREHRNQSEYLGQYLNRADYVDCAEAPSKSPWLAEAWDAGDNWRPGHWVMGRKCLWRNFKGWSRDGRVVEGPKTMYARGEGRVLVSCLLNHGRYLRPRLMSSARSRGAYSENPSTKTNFLWPDFWMRDVAQAEPETAMQSIRLQAGYVDGHVESRNASDTMGVWVTSDPFVVGGGPSLRGMYFLPHGGLR